jgi:hypothetical protein
MTNSNDKGSYNWRNLDELNKFIRLANITGLSFADLNTLLTGWEELRKTYPNVPVNELLEKIEGMLKNNGS